jgi:hypothetical protein
MYSASAGVKMPQFISSQLIPNMIRNDTTRYLPESQLNWGSGGVPSVAIGAQAAPPHEYRQTSVTRHIRKIIILLHTTTNSL